MTPAGSEDDRATIAKLEIGSSVFFGINAGSNPNRRKITLKVNPISRTHAEMEESVIWKKDEVVERV
ncbi:hypothetical protein [Nostoc sp. ChiQUE01b]|uniref:hypothetical protein n=1 Tax=Nostoc sp. ChiQUE01b TaxID=3075376 RepID=UPI002AD3D780|nr:hypothetical protein [Nostoc sp. ChiQUE01b]MDZ8262608.1 hypothetical protein [Nostoc sp. ChiQUE01b]